MAQSLEAWLDGRGCRRCKNEARNLAKFERQHEAADKMIGELSSGKLYIFPVGGKYKEGSRSELIDFLIRNKYVR